MVNAGSFWLLLVILLRERGFIMIIMDMSMNTLLIILSEYRTDVTNNPTELGCNFGSS